MAVTPVRTLSPEINVVSPTSTPCTSVMAFHAPGVPSNGAPKSRARGLDCAKAAEAIPAAKRTPKILSRMAPSVSQKGPRPQRGLLRLGRSRRGGGAGRQLGLLVLRFADVASDLVF